jgi:hypothetical protein
MIHSRSSAQLGSCVAQSASLLPHWTGFGVSPTAGMTLTRARIAIHFFFLLDFYLVYSRVPRSFMVKL